MFKKMMLTLMIAVLALSALPMSAQAAGLSQGDNPPAAPMRDGARLEEAWARLQTMYGKIGERMSHSGDFIADIQAKLETAAAQGVDVTAAQTALDAFAQAVQEARPAYESAQGIIASHQGFDADGKVTDPQKAAETVKALADKMKEIGALTKPAGEALRTALQDLRGQIQPDDDKLSEIWAHLQEGYAKAMARFAHADEFTSRIQPLLDKAAQHGADVTDAQAALDNFIAVVDEAQTAAAAGQAIIDEHAGFDAAGNVTDAEQARATVQSLGDVMKRTASAVKAAGQALRDALQPLRDQFPGRGRRPASESRSDFFRGQGNAAPQLP